MKLNVGQHRCFMEKAAYTTNIALYGLLHVGLTSLLGIILLLGISSSAHALAPTTVAAISTAITRDAQIFHGSDLPRTYYENDGAGRCDGLPDTLGLSIPREIQNDSVDFEEILLAATINERRTMLIFYGGNCSGWVRDVMPLFTDEVATLVREEFYLLPVDVDSNQTYLIDGNDFNSLQLADMLEIAKHCDMDTDDEPPSSKNSTEKTIAKSDTSYNQDSYSTAG